MVNTVSLVKDSHAQQEGQQCESEGLDKYQWVDTKWKQWEAQMLKNSKCSSTDDIIKSLSSILIDPVGGEEMIKEGGIWKNPISGSVFLCKNVLFQLVEDTLKPAPVSVNEVARKSPVSGKPMLKYASYRLPGLIIDKCAESGGFYFDPGELTKLSSLDFYNELKDDQEYREYRDGYTMSRSKHRWTGFGPLLAPGVDSFAVFIKFRTALFFNTSLGVGLSLSSLTWWKWLLSIPNSENLNFKTEDPDFDSLFLVNVENKDLAKVLLDREVREAILDVSQISLYGESSEFEITDDYISYSEGPYTDVTISPWNSRVTAGGKEFNTNYFDKSELVMTKLIKLAKLLELRVNSFQK